MEKKSKSLFAVEEPVQVILEKTSKEEPTIEYKDLSPFDLLKAIFQYSDIEWNKISQLQKSKNFFICNRILSRGFPIAAQSLNWNGISTDYAIDLWRMKLKNRSIPGWIYQKSVSEKQKVEKKALKVSEEMLLTLSKFYKCSIKDLLYFQEIYPDDFTEEVKKFDVLNK